ncbi:MAG: hypothetical protein ABIN67_09955 [Ferruginibacter sp.]
MRSSATIIILVSALIGCNNKKPTPVKIAPADTAKTTVIEVDHDSMVLSLTKQILTAIKAKDYKSFSTFIHPTEGTRFSPYGYIDTSTDLIFTTKEFLSNADQQKKLDWGTSDGSGDKILLSVTGYFKKFVYDADFLHAEKTSLNKMLGAGNSLNNLQDVYKGSDFTESYFSGFDKKYGGMDWTCLRLVYKKYQDKYYLIAVVHDQWTI